MPYRHWVERAACIAAPSEWFVGSEPDEAKALRYCARCEVRRECLEEAVGANLTWGVWGGQTGQQRHPGRTRPS